MLFITVYNDCMDRQGKNDNDCRFCENSQCGCVSWLRCAGCEESNSPDNMCNLVSCIHKHGLHNWKGVQGVRINLRVATDTAVSDSHLLHGIIHHVLPTSNKIPL